MSDEEASAQGRRAGPGAHLPPGFAPPSQPGDVEEYERCRAIILDWRQPAPFQHMHNYVRDRNRGAQGD